MASDSHYVGEGMAVDAVVDREGNEVVVDEGEGIRSYADMSVGYGQGV
jgi:hypothetical protein